MYNSATVIGYLAEKFQDDRGNTILILEDRSGQKTRSIPVRCYPGSEKLMASVGGLNVGSLIVVDGYNGGAKSQSSGKWFGDLNASFIKVISGDSGEF